MKRRGAFCVHALRVIHTHGPRGLSASVTMMAAQPLMVRCHHCMSTKNNSGRFFTGVSLEPEVQVYLDDLAHRMQMSRSWVLNTIIHEYAKLIEARSLVPLSSREKIIRL